MPGRRPAFRLSPLAEDDLGSIWRYTEEIWSSGQAERYHAMMVGGLEELAGSPDRGRPVEARSGYLKYAIGSHFVFYRKAADGIDVIRILHRRMDTDGRL